MAEQKRDKWQRFAERELKRQERHKRRMHSLARYLAQRRNELDAFVMRLPISARKVSGVRLRVDRVLHALNRYNDHMKPKF